MLPLRSFWHRSRRRVLLHRRGLAALLTGLAVLVGFRAAQDAPPPTESVWTAAHDLPAGTVVARADLRRVGYAAGTAPPAAIEDPAEVVGRPLAVPLATGEPVLASRTVGPRLLDDRAGEVAVPVRVSDPDVVEVLRPGDQVDLLAVDPQRAGEGKVLARRVTVVAVPERPGDASPEATPGRLVLVAAPAADAPRLAGAGVVNFVTVVWSR